MDNKDKTYDQLIAEIKVELNKINSTDITMDEAIRLFEEGLTKLKLAEAKLEEYKGHVSKVLSNNKIEEFK